MEIFDGQGIVKEDYKLAWERLYYDDGATPLSYLVRPIVDEMEKSNWSSSESWEQFNRDKIVEALELARNGELEEIMYGKTPIVEDHMIALPDAAFSAEVEALYKRFQAILRQEYI